MKYEILKDGKTVCTLETETDISPIMAMMLMVQKISDEQEKLLEDDSKPRTE